MSDLRENIIETELGNNMLDMVAPIYDRSKVALYIFNALGIVLQKEYDFIIYDFIEQIFIQTATWGLEAWEKEYDITPDPSWDIDQRRANILSTLQYKAPITPRKIADRISGLVGIDTDVAESDVPNTIEVLVRGYVNDFTKIRQLIDKILPAHLIYNLDAHYVVDSKLTNHYAIVASECETFSAGLDNEPVNEHVRIADENDFILLDENMHVLTYSGTIETNDEFTLTDEEGNILTDQDSYYLIYKERGE